MATAEFKHFEQKHYEDYLVARFMFLTFREEWSSVVSD
jgi:hypothetical protein